MAANWEVTNITYDIDTNRALVASWQVTDRDGEFIGRSYGTVDISWRAQSIPYENLNENQVLGWVRAELGGSKVSFYERSATKQREEKQNPTRNNGVPWNEPTETAEPNGPGNQGQGQGNNP